MHGIFLEANATHLIEIEVSRHLSMLRQVDEKVAEVIGCTHRRLHQTIQPFMVIAVHVAAELYQGW